MESRTWASRPKRNQGLDLQDQGHRSRDQGIHSQDQGLYSEDQGEIKDLSKLNTGAKFACTMKNAINTI